MEATKKNLITAAFNSISYQTKDIVDCLEQTNISVNSLSVDGGMAENKTFVGHIASILNIPIQVPKNTEATAKGVAIRFFFVVSLVIPWKLALISESQYGAPKPVKAGIKGF